MKAGVDKRFIFFFVFIVLVFIFLFLVLFADFSVTGNWVKEGSSLSFVNHPSARVILTFLTIVATLGVSFLLFKEISKIS